MDYREVHGVDVVEDGLHEDMHIAVVDNIPEEEVDNVMMDEVLPVLVHLYDIPIVDAYEVVVHVVDEQHEDVVMDEVEVVSIQMVAEHHTMAHTLIFLQNVVALPV